MPSQTSDPPNASSSQSSQTPSIPISVARPSNADSTPVGTPQHSVLGRSPAGVEGKGGNQLSKKGSWYGSWPRKSSASTQVARETILGGTVKSKTTADFSRFNTKKDPDSMSIDLAPASAPVLPGVHESAASETQEPVQEEPAAPPKPDDIDTKQGGGEQTGNQGPEAPSNSTAESRAPTEMLLKPAPAAGWLGGWFGRPAVAVQGSETAEMKADEPNKPTQSKQDEDKALESVVETLDKPAEAEQPQPITAEANNDKPEENKAVVSSSWFGFWSSSTVAPPPAVEPAPQAETSAPAESTLDTVVPTGASQPAAASEDVVMEDAPPVEPTPGPPPKAGSTWAFWSRDSSSGASKKNIQQTEPGQLAVIGESSESRPKRANSMEFKGSPSKEPPLKTGAKEDQAKAAATPLKESSAKKNKRARPLSIVDDATDSSRPNTPKPESSSTSEAPPKAGSSKTPTSAKASPPNLLLPAFSGTYRQKDNPSIYKQIAQLLLRTRQTPTKHVYLVKEPPKIKKAIAIGVHGLYPANYLRPMIGQPTGTSIKFANHCAEGIRRWADANGCEDCEIEKVALEGEGKIGDRVENLWRLLLNWIDQIRRADLVMVSCHSQGVPVSIMLLAKLIELGIITTARVGVCAM
ncbi:hypothetical protein OQA88_561, partial [Cercophora sp. LCS_1]